MNICLLDDCNARIVPGRRNTFPLSYNDQLKRNWMITRNSGELMFTTSERKFPVASS